MYSGSPALCPPLHPTGDGWTSASSPPPTDGALSLWVTADYTQKRGAEQFSPAEPVPLQALTCHCYMKFPSLACRLLKLLIYGSEIISMWCLRKSLPRQLNAMQSATDSQSGEVHLRPGWLLTDQWPWASHSILRARQAPSLFRASNTSLWRGH